MNLSAVVASEYLEGMPPRVVQRLLKNESLATLLRTGSGQVEGIGSFTYAEVINALSVTAIGDSVQLSSAEGRPAIRLTRTPDGSHVLRGESGAEARLPEFGLLDPEVEVRQRSIASLSDRARPWWPKAAFWSDKVARHALNEFEFSELLDDLGAVAEHTLASISDASRKEQVGVPDIIPTRLDYYVSLVGPHPAEHDASSYVENLLAPHLVKLLSTDLQWGLRCLQATCVSEEIDPAQVCRHVESSSLATALQQLGSGPTASGALTTFALAYDRADEVSALSSIAEDCLNGMLDTCASEEVGTGLPELHLALAKLTLRVVSQVEELVQLPAYWRRLAALVHASFLLEAIDFSRSDSKSLMEWCDAQVTPSMLSAQLIDRAAEPLWYSEAQTARQFFASATARAIQIDWSTGKASIPLSVEQERKVEGLAAIFAFLARCPDPLFGGKRRRSALDVPEIGLELMGEGGGEGEGLRSLSPVQRWQAVAHAARIYKFSEELLSLLREDARGLSLSADAERAGTFQALEWVATVAACQPDRELAETVVGFAVGFAGDVDDGDEGLNCAVLIVLASGAEIDEVPRLEWAGDRLTALAFRLKLGEPCRRLSEFLTSAQRSLPLVKRRWGRAIAAARAATA